MPHFCLQGFLSLILLSVISGCRGTENVLALPEEDVRISCVSQNVTDSQSGFRFRLIKHNTGTKQATDVFMWPVQNQDLKRFQFEADGKGQTCLFLRESKKSDEGIYAFQKCQGWECDWLRNISLKVKDCRPSAAVKAAPSRPAILECPVKGQSQEPRNIFWTMQKGNNGMPLDSNRTETNGTHLVIRSVNTTDSGWYRCNYTLGQTRKCFDTNLQVQEGENDVAATTFTVLATSTVQVSEITVKTKDSSKTGIAAVVTIILGIFIIAALIGFIYHRRSTQRITPPSQWRFEDNRASVHGYEVVAPLTDSETQRDNSLYQYPEECMHTFHH